MMTERKIVERFWKDDYFILKETKGAMCPSPDDVYFQFVKEAKIPHLSLESFKV